jgi:alpha-ketoglutarate-dependent taurine dioxygenase
MRPPLPIIEDADSETLRKLIAEKVGTLHRRLAEDGVLLIRGTDLSVDDEFRDFVTVFSGKEPFSYAGGVSPRSSLGNGVYTSTEYSPDIELALHNELSYSPVFPDHIYFFCETAPDVGGETTIGDSHSILQSIDHEIVESFRKLGVRYDRNLCRTSGGGYSWQEAFESDDKNLVGRQCRRMGADFEWLPDNSLRVSQVGPGTIVHPTTGQEVWFNQAAGFHASNIRVPDRAATKPRLSSFFGDGSEIPDPTVDHIREVLSYHSVDHKWRRSDILVLDNLRIAHGRRAFSGDRRIVVAMT